MNDRSEGVFTRSLGCLIEPALAGLATQLGEVPGLNAGERAVFHEGATVGLYDTAHRKVSRLLLLELNTARVTGRLTAGTPERRWDEFLELSARLEFWDSLADRYPTAVARLREVIARRCAAVLAIARRFATDRAGLAILTGGEGDGPGELTRVSFDAGDTHRRGQAVAILHGSGGSVVYKPRSVQIDAALARLLDQLLDDEPEWTRIRVPAVVARDGYGWAEFVRTVTAPATASRPSSIATLGIG